MALYGKLEIVNDYDVCLEELSAHVLRYKESHAIIEPHSFKLYNNCDAELLRVLKNVHYRGKTGAWLICTTRNWCISTTNENTGDKSSMLWGVLPTLPMLEIAIEYVIATSVGDLITTVSASKGQYANGKEVLPHFYPCELIILSETRKYIQQISASACLEGFLRLAK